MFKIRRGASTDSGDGEVKFSKKELKDQLALKQIEYTQLKVGS